MQSRAGGVQFSETTFVLPPDDPSNMRPVRIFNPHQRDAVRRPIPMSAPAWVLAGLGRDRDGVLRFEEIAGLVDVAPSTARNGGRGITIGSPDAVARRPPKCR